MFSLLTGFLTAAFCCGRVPDGASSPAKFEWDSITPSDLLEFHECYQGLQCARLVLPMDWLNASNERTVVIAITKLPAVVHDEDPSFGGTVFSQPGGPGVPGTLYTRNRARKMRDILDIPGRKHYEIIGFDPRGMGHSLPRIDCFPGALRSMWDLEFRTMSDLDVGHTAHAIRIAAAKADGSQCDKVHGDFLAYVGTPNVARDMLAILDGVQELKDRNMRVHHRQQVEVGGLQPVERLELRAATQASDVYGGHEVTAVPRLQYIGISYGTLLGNYFASIFPGRVGRMVLDGIVDADDKVSQGKSCNLPNDFQRSNKCLP